MKTDRKLTIIEIEHSFWTRHGTGYFLVRQKEKLNGYCASPLTQILMGAWCGEELISKPHEITTLAEMAEAKKTLMRNFTFSPEGFFFT